MTDGTGAGTAWEAPPGGRVAVRIGTRRPYGLLLMRWDVDAERA